MRHFALVVAALSAAWWTPSAQDQTPRPNAGWPCNARIDPAYFRTAEATGGQVFLFHPSEVGRSGVLMGASFSHRETLFRVAGLLEDGLHQYAIPVDTAVESVLFSVSLQCLQLVEIARPSGAVLQAADAGVDDSRFEAGHVVIVESPEPGAWTVRVSGHGLFFLVVQAKSTLTLGGLQLVKEAASGESFTPLVGPLQPGSRQRLSLGLPHEVSGLGARLVSAAFDELGGVRLEPAPERDDGEARGAFVVPSNAFRIVVSGTDASGRPFQRVHAPLVEVAGR